MCTRKTKLVGRMFSLANIASSCTSTCEPIADVGIHLALQGKLTDGTVFDSSFERGDPIEFELGSGQVIKGMWQTGSCNRKLLFFVLRSPAISLTPGRNSK